MQTPPLVTGERIRGFTIYTTYISSLTRGNATALELAERSGRKEVVRAVRVVDAVVRKRMASCMPSAVV